MNNPLMAMFGLFIIAVAAQRRWVVFANEAAEHMMGMRVLPFDLFLPSKIPRESFG